MLLALDVNDRYKMQNPNNWYSLQRSSTDQRTYPIQDPASNTPTLTPTGAHNTQAHPAVYSYATAARTTHGKDFRYSSIQSLIVYTTVARHYSHPSVGGHTPYAQPQYYSANGYHCPSPNPPPYTEYATELNRPQSLRRSESESSYWTTVGGDTSRYHVGQSNRYVFPPTSSIDDYMRLLSLASIKNTPTICNMGLTIPTHPIPPMYRPSFHRACHPSPIPLHLLLAYIPPLPPLPLHLTTVRSHPKGNTLNRSPLLFSTIFSTSLAVSSSARRWPSTPTRPPRCDMIGVSVYRDITAPIH